MPAIKELWHLHESLKGGVVNGTLKEKNKDMVYHDYLSSTITDEGEVKVIYLNNNIGYVKEGELKLGGVANSFLGTASVTYHRAIRKF